MTNIIKCDRCGLMAEAENPIMFWKEFMYKNVKIDGSQDGIFYKAHDTHHLCPECYQAHQSFMSREDNGE